MTKTKELTTITYKEAKEQVKSWWYLLPDYAKALKSDYHYKKQPKLLTFNEIERIYINENWLN